jgi:hypothetical protein
MPARYCATRHAFLLAALAAGGAAGATDAPPLPEDFLEYLGSWESDDADWLVANAAAAAVAPQAGAPASPRPTQPIPQRGGTRPPVTMEPKP